MGKTFVLAALCFLAATASAQTENCRSVSGAIASNAWCAMMCSFSSAFCPEGVCTCEPADVGDNDVPFDYAEYWEFYAQFGNVPEGDIVCCDESQEDRTLYFTESDSLYALQISTGVLQECATLYGDPNHLVADQDGDIWVASRTSGRLLRVENCADVHNVFGWPDDAVMVGGAVAFLGGKVYVSGQTDIIELTLNEAKNVISWQHMGFSQLEVGAMASYDGCLYYTESNKDVYKWCPGSGDPALFLSGDDHRFPDIAGIDVTSCGLVLGVSDSNQVWMCEDISGTTASECSRLCNIAGIDADSCVDLGNPWGVSWGCCCDVFVAGRFSGTIVQYDGRSRNNTMQDGDVLLDGRFHPKGVTLVAPAPPCATVPGCNPSDNPTPSATPSASVTPSSTPPPDATWCLGVNSDCDQDAGFITFTDEVTLTIQATGAIIVNSAVCGGVTFGALVSGSGGQVWSETIVFSDSDASLAAWAPGTLVSCTISATETNAPNRAVTVTRSDPSCDLVVDTVSPVPDIVVGLAPGVDVCLGVRENMTIAVTSDTVGSRITFLECNGVAVPGAVGTVLGAGTTTFIVENPVAALQDVSCDITVQDDACNEGTDSDTITTCPPVGRLVGDVQRPTQAGFNTNAISVGVVSAQLLECLDIEPGETPSSLNCRTFPEQLNRVYDVPTVFLELLLDGTTLTPIDPNGVSPIIRLNPLVPVAGVPGVDPGPPLSMCFVYSYPIFNDVANSRTAICGGANAATCASTTSIAEACTSGARPVDKENEILPRFWGSFQDPTEAQNQVDSTDVIAITGNICPGNTITEYSVSYVQYEEAGFLQTADKPSLSPRPTYFVDGVETAPAVCIDTNDHPQLGGLMNTQKGTIICIEDPSLVVADPATQLADFRPPPGEVMVKGDIVPISSSGDNKDTKPCPFRALEGGTDEARYCAEPTSRQCTQFTG